MCVRLYPDIIVAMEIINAIRVEKLYNGDQHVSKTDISIENCIKHQESYKQFGITNVFIGFEDKEWDEFDYKCYISRVGKYFEPIEKGYRVNIDLLQGDTDESDLTWKICDSLFIMGTYPKYVLERLGLFISNRKEITTYGKRN